MGFGCPVQSDRFGLSGCIDLELYFWALGCNLKSRTAELQPCKAEGALDSTVAAHHFPAIDASSSHCRKDDADVLEPLKPEGL